MRTRRRAGDAGPSCVGPGRRSGRSHDRATRRLSVGAAIGRRRRPAGCAAPAGLRARSSPGRDPADGRKPRGAAVPAQRRRAKQIRARRLDAGPGQVGQRQGPRPGRGAGQSPQHPGPGAGAPAQFPWHGDADGQQRGAQGVEPAQEALGQPLRRGVHAARRAGAGGRGAGLRKGQRRDPRSAAQCLDREDAGQHALSPEHGRARRAGRAAGVRRVSASNSP